MISEKEEAILLKNFNRRIEKDFGKVYSLFYNDLFYFAAKLYTQKWNPVMLFMIFF